MTFLCRIDIRYPDGRRETHRLEEGAFSIGSGSDNAAQSADAGLGKSQLRFERAGDAVSLVKLDASRAVTINGEPAPVNAKLPLPDLALIRAGDLIISFNLSGDQATAALDAVDDATQPVAAAFRAEIESAEIRVFPHSSAAVSVRVDNLRGEESLFSLEAAGPAEAWTWPKRLAFAVAGKDSAELLLQITPPRLQENAPGEYPLRVAIQRLDGERGALQLETRVKLGGFAGLSATLDPPDLRPRLPFELRLRNLGNQAVALRLRPREPGSPLSLRLAQDKIRLAAGEFAVVAGIAATSRRPLVGKPRELDFALLAEAEQPHDYLVALPGTVTIKPLLPARALTGLALAIVLLGLALAQWLYQPPQPQIAAFSLSAGQVAQGAPVELSWTALEVERFVIEVDRAPLAQLPGEASSFTLDTGDYADPIDIALIGINGEASDIRTLALEVYQPASIRRFEANRATLPRGIPGDLRISWRVEGASALDIALPAGFETVHESRDGENGEILIRGEADTEVLITLVAEDEIGGQTQSQIRVAVTAPECAPIEDTLLYTGPDSRFERARYALRGVPVLANGVNADGTWLQVELANGARGWSASANFRCHGFDPGSLDVIADIPRLPTPAMSAQLGLRGRFE